jgi:hypothetical protein
MVRKFSFAVLAVLVFVGGLRANDEITAADLNVAGISDVDNKVVEAGLDVDVEALANKTADKSEQAVEAAFHSYGGYNSYCNSYSYGYNYSCYNPCYSYSYCYTPVYYTYRPVCYTTYVQTYTPVYTYCYSPSYTLSSWGCH